MDSDQPEAFLLLSLPDSSLTSAGGTENGDLSLECVSMPNPEATNSQDRDVYLVFRLNTTETVIDPARAVTRTDAPHFRTYTFAPTQVDPAQLVLRIKVPAEGESNTELSDKLETFENILEQYVGEFNGPAPPMPHPSVAPVPQGKTAGVGLASGNKDLRGHLVMINEDTGEVVGEVEDKFKIKEDSALLERGHENDPVVIEVPEETTRDSDANALVAFAKIVPPDQQDWITKSASVVSHAISMTTNLLITTITTASDYYVSHSAASPHHSIPGTPTGVGSKTPVGGLGASGAPPLPPRPRALVFLTSEKTRKGISTVHTISGEAVKISSKTVGVIDGLIRRAMGAKPKRAKYFATGPAGATGTSGLSVPSLPPRAPSPSGSSIAPPPYAPEKPSLPPRKTPSPLPPALPPRAGSTGPGEPSGALPQQPRLTKKDRLLISADLILSTLDDSTRKVLDSGTASIGKVVGHKYGPEAAQSSLMMAGTARNVGLVYVDMRGIGRRALLKRAGKTFVKARIASNKEGGRPVA